MKWSVEKNIIRCGFWLAIFILGIVGIYSYQNTSQTFARERRIDQSYEILQKIRDVLTTLRDAERERRGYIITGKQLYLNTYKTATQTINSKFAAVRQLTAEYPYHQLNLDRIEPLIAERIALIKTSVELYDKNKYDIASQIALTDRGLVLHDEIWRIIAKMEAEERAILQQREVETKRDFRNTLLMNLIGSGSSFILLYAVYYLLDKQISKRQQIEEILRESEQRYRNLFEITPHPVWVYDLENLAFLAVNEEAIKHYGYSRSDFLSMKVNDIYLVNQVPNLLNYTPAMIPEVKKLGVEQHKKRDGTVIDVEIICHDLIFDGRKARLILARDITEQKLAQEALQASEEKFRQIAENIHEMFWMTNADGSQFLYINPAYEEIWGRSCESLYLQPKSFLEAIHPEDRELVLDLHHKSLTKECEIEYRIVRPDGEVRWVWVHSFPIKNAEGEIYRCAGVTTDITERIYMEEVRRTLEKEREMSELKLRFFSMASHELRTPLSTILVSAQLLENITKEWPEEKRKKNLHRIQSAAKTMRNLLTDILTLTRAEAGKLEFKPELTDLDKACKNLVEEIELSELTQQRISFTNLCPKKYFYIDEKLIRSIIGNLLTNAIKYSPQETHVDFTLTCEADNTIFKIQDRGIGIPIEDQQNLFQSFYRCQNVGDVAGTGLGLAVVKKCVELHGGSINVESEIGVGTTFTVKIPVVDCMRTMAMNEEILG